MRLNASLCDKEAASACVVLWHLDTDRYLAESSTIASIHRRTGAHATEKIPCYPQAMTQVVPPDLVSNDDCSLQHNVGTVCTVCHMLQRLFYPHGESTSTQNPAAE